ncbi:MAG TPA: hypothetical protein VGN97_12335 [Mesorhizobium sp.]|jgi:hypothetical protein|nr:hypothetical protein [Mesorhizobium sp.]
MAQYQVFWTAPGDDPKSTTIEDERNLRGLGITLRDEGCLITREAPGRLHQGRELLIPASAIKMIIPF